MRCLGVAVKAGKEVADAEIREYNKKEADDREICRTSSLPAARDPRVQKCSVG